MSGDDIREKIKELPPKAWAGIGTCAILALVMIWVWWPTPSKFTPEQQQSLDANKNDPAAHPPVTEVPASNDGPRRKATKTK
ncbi:MAG: hypothetical protein QM783_16335 [Phycisphaerales bacterium]